MSKRKQPRVSEEDDFLKVLLDTGKSDAKRRHQRKGVGKKNKEFMSMNDSNPSVDSSDKDKFVVREKGSQRWYLQDVDVNVDAIPFFDPTNLVRCPLFMVFGARRVGKTHLMTWMLSFLKDQIDEAYLFSKSRSVQIGAWNMIVPEHRFEGLQEDKLEAIWNRQRQRFQELDDILVDTIPDNQKRQDTIKDRVQKVHIVFDDIISDNKLRNSPLIDDIFVLGRHYNIGATFLSQAVGKAASFNSMCRPNVDYVLSSHMNSSDDWELLSRCYLSFGHWHDGYFLAKEVTKERFQFIVAKHCIDSDDPELDRSFETCVRRIKAPEKTPKYELGDKELWARAKFLERRRNKARLAPTSKNKAAIQKIRLPKGGFISGVVQPVTELKAPVMGIISSLRNVVRVG